MRRNIRLGMVAASLIGVLALASPPAWAQDEMTMSESSPATRPARAAGRSPRSMVGPLIERARAIVSGLNLSAEQKQKIDAILKDAAASGNDMMEQMEDLAPRDRMERMRGRFTEVREQIAAVLDDKQKIAFREKIEGYRRELAGAAPGQNLRPGQLIEQFRDSLEKLELTAEQQKKADAVVDEARDAMKELREGLQAGDEMAREKLGLALQDLRSQTAAILTAPQRAKLRRLMEAGSADGPAMGPGMMDDDGPMRRRDARRGREAPRPASPVPAALEKLKVGARAPDFALKRLEGQTIRLADLEGRTVVLVFGSYSTPSFRQRAAGLEQLKKELGQRASFFLVYTKEAHPKGEWEVERNRDDEIEVEPHQDLDDREAMARKAKDALKLTVPILVDGMDDAAASAYGLAPNGAVVIGPDLKVVARQQWFDPYTLRRHIEAASRPSTRPAASAD